MPINAPNYQFPEDVPHESGDRGTMALGVRNDNDIVFTDNDLDYTPISLDASGAINVVILDSDLPITGRILTCETDSISVCQLDEFTVAVTGTVDVRSLDCSLDSVTICPPVSGIFEVEVVNPVEVVIDQIISVTGRALDCDLDSVTICPPASGIFDVEIINQVDTRFLDCTTDSITVCIDQPLAITGIVEIEGSVEVTGFVSTTRDIRKRRGAYLLASPESTLTTAADAATSGRFWLVNTSSTVLLRLVEAHFTCVLTSLVDLAPATPDVTMERMTFTGTPTGATVAPAQRDTAEAVNIGTFRTAPTGMTITAGAKFVSWIPVTLSVIGGLLAANTAAVAATEQIFSPRDDSGDIIIRQNQGIVWRQNTAGTANEARIIQIDIIWEEFDI